MTTPSDRPAADRRVRIGVLAAALVFLLAGSAAILWRGDLARWVANDLGEIGGPFELVDQDGRPFTRADLIGNPHVLYFGFTFCPDLCPTTLFQLASVVNELGDEAEPLKVAFVSVDPERDTVPVMKEYVSAFHPRFIGLTGAPEAIAAAAKAYRIFHRKVELEDGDYTIDHTASALLFNADGSYFDSVLFDESHESARAKVDALLAANR